MDRKKFSFILRRIEQRITKEPTVMVPNPTESHQQLVLTIFRMSHGTSPYIDLLCLAGVSYPNIQQVIRVLLSSFYDELFKPPGSEKE